LEASENIAPTAMHDMKAPSATITHPYRRSLTRAISLIRREFGAACWRHLQGSRMEPGDFDRARAAR
jgi:hypothetical protein